VGDAMALVDILYGGITPLKEVASVQERMHELPNLFEHVDSLGPTGRLIAATSDEFFQGVAVPETAKMSFGWTNLFDENAAMVGYTEPNILGGAELIGTPDNASTIPTMFGGLSIPETPLKSPSLESLGGQSEGIDFEALATDLKDIYDCMSEEMKTSAAEFTDFGVEDMGDGFLEAAEGLLDLF